MRILSLSSVYPNPVEPELGLFVRSRLTALAKLAEVRVIAPVPLLDYSNPRGKLWRKPVAGLRSHDQGIEVYHPRWLFPPNGMPVNVAFQFARLLPFVQRIRREFDFDLIDAHFCYPEGVTAALLSAVYHRPFAVTLRGSELTFDRYRPRRAVMRWAIRRADAVIAVAEPLRQFAISRGAAPERTVSIPNGIDAAVFFPRDRRATRRELGVESYRKVILSTGELIEAKGHQLVVKALQGLLKVGVDAEVWIAGGTARGGPRFEQTLRGMIREWGLESRVKLLGWVHRDRLPELLSAADIFCLASYSEGWPNVVHEALACGTPVVATGVGGVPEMIVDPSFGTVVPPRDATALENALAAALQREWDCALISRWGRSRTWSRVAREVLDVFERIVSDPAPTNREQSFLRHFR